MEFHRRASHQARHGVMRPDLVGRVAGCRDGHPSDHTDRDRRECGHEQPSRPVFGARVHPCASLSRACARPSRAYTVRMIAAAPWKNAESVEVLAFDIFGTVVDWHASIVRELGALHPQVDGDAFALAWRAGYRPAMARVMSGELGW